MLHIIMLNSKEGIQGIQELPSFAWELAGHWSTHGRWKMIALASLVLFSLSLLSLFHLINLVFFFSSSFKIGLASSHFCSSFPLPLSYPGWKGK